MKLIIAGSRNIDCRIAFWEALCLLEPYGDLSLNLLLQGNVIKELVTGCCSTGPDQVPYMIFDWWESSGYGVDIDLVEFPADWDAHGKAAGPIRNRQMAEYADVLLLIWDGKSKGSLNMKREMEKLDKPVHEVILK